MGRSSGSVAAIVRITIGSASGKRMNVSSPSPIAIGVMLSTMSNQERLEFMSASFASSPL
jgi:hypothetical protein